MLNKIYKIGVIALMVIMLIVGVVARFSFTDMTKDDSVKDVTLTAVFPDSTFMLDEALWMIENDIDNEPYAFIVTPVSDYELHSVTCYVKAKVVEVIKGEGVKAEEEIYITRSGWRMYTGWEGYEEGEFHLDQGFVSHMKQGEEYLVVLHEKVYDVEITNHDVYLFNQDYLLTTAYNLAETESKPIRQSNEENTYVSYARTDDSEFLLQTEEQILSAYKYKRNILEKFGL